MKIKAIIYFSLLAFLASSCADFLDKMPDDQKTMDMVWSKKKETEKYLYNVYANLPKEGSMWEEIPWSGASDEADYVWPRYQTYQLNLGNWNPTSTHYTKWGDYYNSIRASFVFENNVDKCAELQEAEKTLYKAEVKFLRGYFYWLLLKQYGPVVLIKEETKFDDDWNSYARSPYDECVEYIIQMMDEAEVDLPWTFRDDPKWMGKPDKIACKAVKSEVRLMAASPQWNGNSEYSNFKNHDGTPLTNTTYDEEKWKLAAQAAKDVITEVETRTNLGLKLYKNNDPQGGGESVFNPYKSVRDVHYVRWSCECLWGSINFEMKNLEKHSMPRPGGWNGMGVTQRQVDAYYMMDGKTIDDSDLYVEEGFATTAHPEWKLDEVSQVVSGDSWGHRIGEWNMYANREARFYATVLYNGRPIPQVPANSRDLFNTNANKDGWGRVELYGEGTSGAKGDADHSTTGYLLLKYTNPRSNPRENQIVQQTNFTYIRLAKIYLNYIEALNEYDPNHTDIKKYWDMIRERAGLPSIFDTYPAIKGNKAKQLEYIIRERQVELAFEHDRYFTTRRRWISHTTDTSHPEERRMYGDGGPIYGLNISAGSDFSNTEFYQRTKVEDRAFEKKMYIFPLPQSEMDRNKSLVQNPWW